MARPYLIGIGVLLALLVIFAGSPLGNRFYMNLRPADEMLRGWEDYRATAFERASQAREPVLVEIYASWCPVCLAQQEALNTLIAQGKLPELRAFRVDYERDKDFLAQHNVRSTGTMILFLDGQEAGRALGLVTAPAIEAFLDRHMDNEAAS